jgi:hypothetical protein
MTGTFEKQTAMIPTEKVDLQLPRTKKGEFKHKLRWEERLHVLDPSSTTEETERRLFEFRQLFAFRFSDAIITWAGQGPRAWTKLIGRIYMEHIAKHLQADRVPTQPPQWIGARSYPTSYFAALDVDADRTPEQILAEKFNLEDIDDETKADLLRRQPRQKPKPPFDDR